MRFDWQITEQSLRAPFRDGTVTVSVPSTLSSWHRRTIHDYFPVSPMPSKAADVTGSILRGLVPNEEKAKLDVTGFIDILSSADVIMNGDDEKARAALRDIFRGNYLARRKDRPKQQDRNATVYPFHLLIAAAGTIAEDRGLWRWLSAISREDPGIIYEILATFNTEKGLSPAEKLFLAAIRSRLDIDPTPTLGSTSDQYRSFCRGLSRQFVDDMRRILSLPLPRFELLDSLNRTISFYFVIYFIRLALEMRKQSEQFFESLVTDDWSWVDSFPSCFDCRTPADLPPLSDEEGPLIHLILGHGRIGVQSESPTSFKRTENLLYISFFDFICFRLARSLFREVYHYNASDYREIGRAIRDNSDFKNLFHEATGLYKDAYLKSVGKQRISRWSEVSRRFHNQAPISLFHEAIRQYYLVGRGSKAPDRGGPGAMFQFSRFAGLGGSRPRVGKYWTLNNELFLLLSHLIVPRGQRLPLNLYFQGLKRYGLHIDEEAGKHIVSWLMSLGMLQKFSDSGDATYVRSLY